MRRIIRIGLAWAGGLAIALSSACGPRTEGLDASKLPENVRADYEVFATKCSKCHSLARPLQAGITDDEQWVMYVKRMRRQPGSGISPHDEEVILRFLRYYAADLRRVQAEKRSGGGASAPTPASAAPAAPAPSPAAPAPAAPAPAPADGGSP